MKVTEIFKHFFRIMYALMSKELGICFLEFLLFPPPLKGQSISAG